MCRNCTTFKHQINKPLHFYLKKEFYYLDNLFFLIFSYPVDERCIHKYLNFLYTSKKKILVAYEGLQGQRQRIHHSL